MKFHLILFLATVGITFQVPLENDLVNKKNIQARVQIDQTTLDTARSRGLASHNKYRATHLAPALQLDATINGVAQAYAQTLAASGTFQHSNNANYGENLYMSCYSGSGSFSTSALAGN